MTAFKTILNAGRAHLGWLFPLLWIAASYLGGLLYFIPVGLVHLVLGLDRLGEPAPNGEIAGASTALMVLAAILCGAACGSTIGLGQWLVLRGRVQRVGLWVAATIAGYASLGLLPLIAAAFEPDWLNWALMMIMSGKLHWLARVQPEWLGASWTAGAITLTLFGVVLGLAQWLALRGRVRHAGWWIPISAAGWALTVAWGRDASWVDFVTISFGLPILIAALGLTWLLRTPLPALRSSTNAV